MAIVVEDGTGLANADSYISIADALIYLADYGEGTDFSTASTADQEIALRKATQYMDGKYHSSWKGTRKTETQSLDWPRVNAVDSNNFAIPDDEVPLSLANATALMAEESAAGNVLLNNGAESGTISREKAKVGPIESDITYQGGKAVRNLYQKARAMIQDLIHAGFGIYSERG